MEHFSYNKESKVITLHQITNYNEDDNVRDIDREDWTDMLVLDVKPKPDRELIELGIIFDHNEAAFMGSMITKVYMANLTGNSTQRSKTNVAQSFGAATFECQKSPLILSNVYLASIVTYGVCIHVPYVVSRLQLTPEFRQNSGGTWKLLSTGPGACYCAASESVSESLSDKIVTKSEASVLRLS